MPFKIKVLTICKKEICFSSTTTLVLKEDSECIVDHLKQNPECIADHWKHNPECIADKSKQSLPVDVEHEEKWPSGVIKPSKEANSGLAFVYSDAKETVSEAPIDQSSFNYVLHDNETDIDGSVNKNKLKSCFKWLFPRVKNSKKTKIKTTSPPRCHCHKVFSSRKQKDNYKNIDESQESLGQFEEWENIPEHRMISIRISDRMISCPIKTGCCIM